MKKELESIFKNEEFGQLRTFIDLEGKPWMAGVDVARALGYKNPSNAVQVHCKLNKTVKHRMNNKLSNGNYEIIFIEESNFYRLVIKSTLPSAEKFQDWIVEEILPSLRQTGNYNVNSPSPASLPTPDLLTEEIEKLKKENELLKDELIITKHASKLIPLSGTAKFYNMREFEFKSLLRNLGIDLGELGYSNDKGKTTYIDHKTHDAICKALFSNFSRMESLSPINVSDSSRAFVSLVSSNNLDNLPF